MDHSSFKTKQYSATVVHSETYISSANIKVIFLKSMFYFCWHSLWLDGKVEIKNVRKILHLKRGIIAEPMASKT
jgi:hypothetical protein